MHCDQRLASPGHDRHDKLSSSTDTRPQRQTPVSCSEQREVGVLHEADDSTRAWSAKEPEPTT